MSVFLLRRFATFVLTLLVASVVVFAVLELLPGNAAEVILGDTATPESLAALNAKLGLDRPPLTRYADWMGGLARGETANSISYDTPTAELIAERLRVTLPLALLAMALTTVLALGLGVYAASRHNQLGDVGVMAASQIGIAIPNFWFAILLILLFAVQLQWVSAGGFPGWTEDDGGGLWEGLKALMLPAIALALVQAAILARVTRSAVLEVMREDFVRTARAKGLIAAPGAVAPRAAQRDDPGADGDGPAVRQPDHRHHRGRERVRAARRRPADLPGHQQPRPGGRARRGDAARRGGRDRQLHRRRAVCADRPAAAPRMSTAHGVRP